MSQEKWKEVDEFFEKTLLEEDAVLEEILRRSKDAGLPPHNVSPCQAQLLSLLVRITGARRVLEVGTLGGYSTIWMARALPENGVIVTIESSKVHAKVARQNFVTARIENRIRLLESDAKVALKGLAKDRVAPFDLVFIDADKPSNPQYLALALKLARSGSVIISDNVVRDGEVANYGSEDPNVIGIRQYCIDLKSLSLPSTGIQTVGTKGYDGFSISIVP